MTGLLAVFVDVLTPVFALVLLGYVAGPRLGLDARTLNRVPYYLLAPAFIFNVISTAEIAAGLALRMTLYILAVQIGCALTGLAVARLRRCPPRLAAAYVLVAVFGNVGNFGLPIVQFALGAEALVPAAVYFLCISSSSFLIGVAAASWTRGGGLTAAGAVLRTPALLALPPALLVNWFGIVPPPFVARPVALLAAAMVPVMLLALGVQLADAGLPRLNADLVAASAVRLLGGPLLAAALAVPFGLAGLARDAGIVQASTPAAVFASIIAFEKELLPEFVTAAVLFSTLASLVTMAIVLTLL